MAISSGSRRLDRQVRHRRGSGEWRTPLAVLVLAALAFVLGHGWRVSEGNGARAEVASRAVTPRAALMPQEQATINLFREASPAVVHVTAMGVKQTLFRAYRTEGTGTGFVWDDRGHIVTNFHVIGTVGARLRSGAVVGRVTLSDQSSWEATLVGYSVNKDLAVLRIEAPKALLHPLPLGTSHDLMVGQQVLAIGNPFGLDQTLTTGVISALGREIESLNRTTIHGVVQTDAAINPGNSGGPLLDSAGRLIGVNTAIYSPSGAYAGIGFAIPVDTVLHVVPDLVDDGAISTPGLGVELVEVQYRRDQYGLYIHSLLAGGAAQLAGLRGQREDEYGDVIVAIDGKPTPTVRELTSALQDYQPGHKVKVSVIRDVRRSQRIEEVEVTLQTLPGPG